MVLRDGVDLAGDEVDVTIMFIDIRDFTAFAERASAAEVVQELNAFYECVVPIVLRHGGHANKFVGDGLLAVFGAPDRLADHADRALDAACEIVHAASGRYRTGIGINSGTVAAGTIGGGGRVEFTVIGDAVNTAARVEEATRQTGDGILITEATRRLLRRPPAGLQEREPVPLKGKRDRVPLWAVPITTGTRLRSAAARR
jgi:class 3 adenylate cyclase